MNLFGIVVKLQNVVISRYNDVELSASMYTGLTLDSMYADINSHGSTASLTPLILRGSVEIIVTSQAPFRVRPFHLRRAHASAATESALLPALVVVAIDSVLQPTPAATHFDCPPALVSAAAGAASLIIPAPADIHNPTVPGRSVGSGSAWNHPALIPWDIGSLENRLAQSPVDIDAEQVARCHPVPFRAWKPYL